MIDTIIFLVIGVIGYSVLKSLLHNKNSSSERHHTSTFLNDAIEWTNDFAEQAKKIHAQTKFETEYCSWFKNFNNTVSHAIEMAEQDAEIEIRVNVSPEHRKLYDELLAQYSAKRIETSPKPDLNIEFGWAHEGPPPAPANNSNTELDALFTQIYRDRLDRHERFIQDINRKLNKDKNRRRFFTKYMRDWNLWLILYMNFFDKETSDETAARDIASEALYISRKIVEPTKRVRALLNVAEGLANIGDISSANAAIGEAIEIANSPQRDRTSLPETPPGIQDSPGDASCISITDHRLAEPSEHSKMLINIIKTQISLKDVIDAQNTTVAAIDAARKIPSAEDRCRALRETAKAMAEAGNIKDAKSVLDEAIISTQEIEELTPALFRFPPRPARDQAIAAISEIQAKIGDFSGAVTTAKKVQENNKWVLNSLLKSLAEYAADGGDISRALEITHNIEQVFQRCQALAYVANAQVNIGDRSGAGSTIAEAIEISKLIDTESNGYEALVKIVEAQTSAGDIMCAIENARSVPNAAARAHALSVAAAAQARTGDVEGAKSTAHEALEAANNAEHTDGYERALLNAAVAYTEAGCFTKALEAATNILDSARYSYVLVKIAKILIRDEKTALARSVIQQALVAARSHPDMSNMHRIESLHNVAELQAMIGDNSALQTALSLGYETRVDHALNAVALANAGSGDLAQALKVAICISDLELRSRTTISIAVAYSDRNKHSALDQDEAAATPNQRKAEQQSSQKNQKYANACISQEAVSAGSKVNSKKRAHETYPDAPPIVKNLEQIRSKQRELRNEVESRRIPHLVHFTLCENLPSICKHGLLSISDCRKLGLDPIRNDSIRLDGRPEATSLSVTFPNYRMFYKYRQIEPTADWAVLILSADILWEKQCSFFKHNAADTRMRKLQREQTQTATALREMFDEADNSRQEWLLPYDPTDPQAEIMVYDAIEPHLIETIAFETRDVAGRWSQHLGGIGTIYAGKGKGLFGTRAKVRET